MYRNINLTNLEKIEVIDKGLKWKPWIVTHIARNREEAMREASAIDVDIKIFMDRCQKPDKS